MKRIRLNADGSLNILSEKKAYLMVLSTRSYIEFVGVGMKYPVTGTRKCRFGFAEISSFLRRPQRPCMDTVFNSPSLQESCRRILTSEPVAGENSLLQVDSIDEIIDMPRREIEKVILYDETN